MDSMTLLGTQSLNRQFGGLYAVRNVTLEVYPGQVQALIGPNGAGKTTLVSMLCGRLQPSSGSISFNGKDITRLPAWQRVRLGIVYTFQITSIYHNLSVGDNLSIASRYSHREGQNSHQIVEQVIEQVGLSGMRDQVAGALAYGHQRLLEIAMGLCLAPKLLILDEPTQGLSDGEIESFCNLLRGIRDISTILLIEHNMSVVMQLADTITVLEQGSILAQGSPSDIRANQDVQKAYLGG
ncbi:MAG: branched-chain amino acid transport system ATP-binding protein [Parasphingorhabdus sp.]|jgi:branched-chain amino acid transport system ATP-binding protein